MAPASRRQEHEPGDAPAEPAATCAICPRLVAFRAESAAREPDWYNGAVPSFGDPAARLLIVGLAPGLGGANRTGRPFTGDFAGDLLYETLTDSGFARGTYGARADDGLSLADCMITNAVRCVPPANKPTAAEIAACRPHLAARIAALPNLREIVVLGRVAHDSTLRALSQRLKEHVFAHGAVHQVKDLTVSDSYHCSRYNTNTGRLTREMFREVFEAVRRRLAQAA